MRGSSRPGAGRLVATAAAVAAMASGALVATAGTAGAASAKAPVKIFVTAPLSDPTIAFPDVLGAAQAAAGAINAKGGINGHKIVLQSCNDSLNPNQATVCARKAVAANVTAVTGLFVFAQSTFSVITKIPVVDGDPLAPPSNTAPNSFPLDGGTDSAAQGVGEKMAQGGAKNVAILYGPDAVETSVVPYYTAGVQSGGGKVVTKVEVPDNAPDFGPYVQQALAPGNVQGILFVGVTGTLPKLVLAAKQADFTGKIGTTLASVTNTSLKSLGSAADNLLLANWFYVPPSKQAAQFTADMKKYSPSTTIANTVVDEGVWASIYTIATALKGKSSLTAATLQKALSAQKALHLGPFAPTINMTKPGPQAGSPRYFNTSVVAYTVRNGKFVSIGGFFNPFAKSKSK